MSNQTLRKAPILCFSELKEDRCNTERFYKLPQELMDAVMYGLSGNCLNQLKIMIVLLGTLPGFGISEEFMLQRTGMSKYAYWVARKALIEKGWIRHEKKPNQLIVDLDKIWEDYYDKLREKGD
ncbi:MAG: hypothetical protein MR911_10820 [Spirochaetia bacterium]|nr:hypothetical protein [Spirochaetia bacterium]